MSKYTEYTEEQLNELLLFVVNERDRLSGVKGNRTDPVIVARRAALKQEQSDIQAALCIVK